MSYSRSWCTLTSWWSGCNYFWVLLRGEGREEEERQLRESLCYYIRKAADARVARAQRHVLTLHKCMSGTEKDNNFSLQRLFNIFIDISEWERSCWRHKESSSSSFIHSFIKLIRCVWWFLFEYSRVRVLTSAWSVLMAIFWVHWHL